MKAIEGYFLITPDDLHWRPSNLIKSQTRIFLSAQAVRILARGSGGYRPKAQAPCTSTFGRRNSISFWKRGPHARRRRDVDRAEIRRSAGRARPVAPGVQRHRRRATLAYRRRAGRD